MLDGASLIAISQECGAVVNDSRFSCRSTMPTRSVSCKAKALDPAAYPDSSKRLLGRMVTMFTVPETTTLRATHGWPSSAPESGSPETSEMPPVQ